MLPRRALLPIAVALAGLSAENASWHPSGNYIAYSVNKTSQGFHEVRNERVEVFDQASDVVVYNVKTNELFTCTQLKTSAFETFPVFSPDGNTLYFCSSKKQDIQNARTAQRINSQRAKSRQGQ